MCWGEECAEGLTAYTMKIVVWVVSLIFAGTACLVCARCYEDLCNEKRCQICEEVKRHCNTESTSTKCNGFCKGDLFDSHTSYEFISTND